MVNFFQENGVPEEKPTTRLILEDEENEAHLSAMTVRLGDHAFFEEKRRKLGEDPLATDPDVEDLFQRVSKSKKTISKLLMDQGYFAGVGNIYRAEILFVSRTDPNLKGSDMTREQFDRVWNASVSLMKKLDFEQGRIQSISAAEAKKLKATISKTIRLQSIYMFDLSWTYQIVLGRVELYGFVLAVNRVVLSQKSSREVFHSKCASEPLVLRKSNPLKLSVKELRSEIERYGLNIPKRSRKADLVKILSEYKQDLKEAHC